MKGKKKKELKIEDLKFGDFITLFDKEKGKRTDTVCLIKNPVRYSNGKLYITNRGEHMFEDVAHISKQGYRNIKISGTWVWTKDNWVPSTATEKNRILKLMETEGLLWNRRTKTLTKVFKTGRVLKDKNTGKLFLHRKKWEGGNVAIDGSYIPNDGDFEEATSNEEKNFFIKLKHNGYRWKRITDKKGFMKHELVNLMEKHNELSVSEKILYNEFELLCPDMDDRERIENVKMVWSKIKTTI